MIPSPTVRRAAGRHVEVRGTVQGVGFRPWAWRLAREEGLAGWIRNGAGGVTIEVRGDEEALDRFVRRLRVEAPPAARVESLRSRRLPPESVPDAFDIVGSASDDEVAVSIPPDLATCRDCLEEVADPARRRHRYAFTNCTACGLRYTIALGVPYDRAATTMASFELCPACRREYEDPADRRFHAEPIACPECGPRLALRASDGGSRDCGDPLGEAAAALRRGEIVAVKGLGGFHLACDATDEAAVQRLRERKRREHRPFAVMVPDLDAARVLARLGPEEEALLSGAERPIVLARRTPDCSLACSIAPDLPVVGLMLPYTPLHELLLSETGRPLVMTSGNLSNEPMAWRDDEAIERLGPIADLFLVHDRPIASRCDDSVAAVVAGGPVLLRRSRGWVPRPIRLPRPVGRPVLAFGAHLKSAACLAVGDQAVLGAHVGDLETIEACDALERSAEQLERFLDVQARVIACDLHPELASSALAAQRARRDRLPLVEVQHHHAHVASALAEHRIEGPVLAWACDGTGLGTDGSAWGCELLRADAAGFERLVTSRPLPLPGGELAIREPWRLALAVLDDAFEGDPPLARLGLFDEIDDDAVGLVRAMIARGVNSPPAHGLGRLFDAVGAMGLRARRARHEGEIALRWNLAADGDEVPRPGRSRGAAAYPTRIERKGPEPEGGAPAAPAEIDWRPLVRAATSDLLRGAAPATVSARFHTGLAAALSTAARNAAARTGLDRLVLTGGCFANGLLADGVRRGLPELRVLLHREVPPGDGGLALGQVLVADAMIAGGEVAATGAAGER